MSESQRSVGLAVVLLGLVAGCDRDNARETVTPGAPGGAGGGTRGGVVVAGKRSTAFCPGHGAVVLLNDQGSSQSYDTIPLVGLNTQIPEFHDCQRFIDSTGGNYGPLVGIFAVSSVAGFNPVPAIPRGVLDLRDGPETSDTGAREAIAPAPRHREGYPVAVVVNFDLVSYEPLGIRPGFNCLYVYPSGDGPHGLGAIMVPVGPRPNLCATAYSPGMVGTELLVYGKRMPLDHPNDYPPVARWDWDQSTMTQYAGIRCGQRWCEIGQKSGFERSPTHLFPIADRKERRVFAVKGWHDEQWLARPGINGLYPAAFRGTLVPVRNLIDFDSNTFSAPTWVDVARVTITPFDPVYESKFHLTTSSMPYNMNQIALCQGSWEACLTAGGGAARPTPTCPAGATATWWARITNTRKETRYHCVTRMPHIGASMPGTARWLWDDADELIWVECDEGCCRVHQGDV